jgi:excinuclease UvrABC nuclease subunit
MFAPESFDLSSLPYLPLSDKSKLPSCPAIYFAVSSKGSVLYIGRSVDICERFRRHHRVPLLEALGGVKIVWLEQSNLFALPRLEETLIKYFNPPLNKIPSYLNKEKSEKLIRYLDLTDDVASRLIPINQLSKEKQPVNRLHSERKLHPRWHQKQSQSEFEADIPQAKSNENLEQRLANLQLIVQEQAQVNRQLTEALVEQAKIICELSQTQAESNNRLSQLATEQALTISKLSKIIEQSGYQDEGED